MDEFRADAGAAEEPGGTVEWFSRLLEQDCRRYPRNLSEQEAER